MERPKPAAIAWGALIGGIAAYDYLCPQGETLSEGADRALESPVGKVLTMGAIGAVALHLTNLIPERYDIVHRLVTFKP